MRTVQRREQYAAAEQRWRSFIRFVFSLLDTPEVHRIMLNGCCGSLAGTWIRTVWGCAGQVRAGGRTVLSKDQCHTCQRNHIPWIEHRLARALSIYKRSTGRIQIKKDEAAFDGAELGVIA